MGGPPGPPPPTPCLGGKANLFISSPSTAKFSFNALPLREEVQPAATAIAHCPSAGLFASLFASSTGERRTNTDCHGHFGAENKKARKPIVHAGLRAIERRGRDLNPRRT